MVSLLNKYKNMSLPFKTTIWFLFCSFFLKGISFISAPIFTRSLSTEEYGIQAVFSSYEQIFLIFSTFEMAGGAYLRGLLKYKNQKKDLLQAILLLSSILTSIVFCFFLLTSSVFCNLTDVSLWTFILMFIYFLFYPAFQCWMMKNRFEYKYKAVVISTIFMSLCSTSGSLLAVKFLSPTAECKIISGFIINILICSIFYFRYFPWIGIGRKINSIRGIIKYALRFQGPLVLHSLSYFILAQMDRIMISALDCKSNAGIYSVAYSVAIVVSVFQGALRDAFSPYRLQCLESKKHDGIKKTTNGIIILMFFLVCLFILLVPELYSLLFTQEYEEGLAIIPPITASMFFMSLYGIFVDVEEYYCKTKYVAIASIVAAVLNIILNYLGMLVFSYEICAYTTLLTYFVMAFMHLLFTCKILKEQNIMIKSVFDIKIIGVFSLLSIVLGFLFTKLIPYILIRYIIATILFVIAFVKRKKIISIIKER